MGTMRSELQDASRRVAFIAERMEVGGLSCYCDEDAGLACDAAVEEQYMVQIEDGLSRDHSWLDVARGSAAFAKAIRGIENYLEHYTIGFLAGYRAASCKNGG